MKGAERTRKMSREELCDALIDAGIANTPQKVAFLKAIHARKRAAKILGDLPGDPEEVRLTLRLAMRMHREWVLGEPAGLPKNGGAR